MVSFGIGFSTYFLTKSVGGGYVPGPGVHSGKSDIFFVLVPLPSSVALEVNMKFYGSV
jgi:hypothetical protein